MWDTRCELDSTDMLQMLQIDVTDVGAQYNGLVQDCSNSSAFAMEFTSVLH